MPEEPTDEQVLADLRAARTRIITRGAASYSINGRTFTALNLSDLNDLITEYERKVDDANSGMFTGRGRFV